MVDAITDTDNIDPFTGQPIVAATPAPEMTVQEAQNALVSGSPATNALSNPTPAARDQLNQLATGGSVPSPTLATQPPAPTSYPKTNPAMSMQDAWDSLVMGAPVRENETGKSSVIPPAEVPPAKPTSVGEYTQQTVDNTQDIARATQAQTDANVAKNDKLAEFWAGVSKDDRNRLQDDAKVATLSANLANGSIARNQKLNDIQANTKIDPNNHWNSLGTGGKVQAVIGLMLGGLGQGLMVYGGNKGAHNYALDALDKAIEDDINSQKANKQGLIDAVLAQHGITDSIQNRQRIEYLNNHAEWENGHQTALDELQRATAEAQNPVDKANGQLAIAQLQQKIADEQRRWGAYNDTLKGATASQLRKIAQDQLKREQDLQDQANKAAAEKELQAQKDAAAQTSAEKSQNRQDLNKQLDEVTKGQELLRQMNANALNGNSPTPEQIAEAARLGIAIPNKSTTLGFGADNINTDYAAAATALAERRRDIEKRLKPAPATETPAPPTSAKDLK